MVFHPPSWVPKLPFDPPDTVSIPDFMLNDASGRCPMQDSRPFFTCGISGKSYTSTATRERVDLLARAIGKELGWQSNKGSEWDKVACVFAANTVRAFTLLE